MTIVYMYISCDSNVLKKAKKKWREFSSSDMFEIVDRQRYQCHWQVLSVLDSIDCISSFERIKEM